MASFSQAISDAFSAIFQLFASIFQSIVSAFQSLFSLVAMLVKDIANISVGLIQFLLQNIVFILVLAGSFFAYVVYQQRHGKPIVPGKKLN